MADCVSDGKNLFICDSWQTDWNKPEQYRLWWPTGLAAREYLELLDQSALLLSPGLFRVNGLFVVLENREKTKPIKIETRPVKKPRGAQEWRNGGWLAG